MKKKKRKTFWKAFGWEGERKKMDGAWVFSPQVHHKVFSPK